MSTRAELIANPGTGQKTVAESEGWVPLLWIALLSVEEIEAAADEAYVTIDRAEGIQRCEDSIDFLVDLFPEFVSIPEVAKDFLKRLKKLKAKQLAIDWTDHVGIRPDTFVPSLTIAVTALQIQSRKASFRVPATTFTFASLGTTMKIKAVTCKTTREVLCYAADIEPCEDDEAMAEEQLMGLFS